MWPWSYDHCIYIYLSVNITIKIYDIDSWALHVVFDTTIVDISLSVAYDVNGFTKVLQFSPPIKLTATRWYLNNTDIMPKGIMDPAWARLTCISSQTSTASSELFPIGHAFYFLHMMTQNCMLLDADVSPKKTIQQTFNIFK